MADNDDDNDNSEEINALKAAHEKAQKELDAALHLSSTPLDPDAIRGLRVEEQKTRKEFEEANGSEPTPATLTDSDQERLDDFSQENMSDDIRLERLNRTEVQYENHEDYYLEKKYKLEKLLSGTNPSATETLAAISKELSLVNLALAAARDTIQAIHSLRDLLATNANTATPTGLRVSLEKDLLIAQNSAQETMLRENKPSHFSQERYDQHFQRALAYKAMIDNFFFSQGVSDPDRKAMQAKDNCESMKKEWAEYRDFLLRKKQMENVLNDDNAKRLKDTNELIEQLDRNLARYNSFSLIPADQRGLIYYGNNAHYMGKDSEDSNLEDAKQKIASILGMTDDDVKAASLTLNHDIPKVTKGDRFDLIRVHEIVLKESIPTRARTVGSIQRISRDRCTTAIYFKPGSLKGLDNGDYLRWAAIEVENFRAASQHPDIPIVLSGTGPSVPLALVAAMKLYCRAMNYPDCIDRTASTYNPSDHPDDVNALRKQLENPKEAEKIYGKGNANVSNALVDAQNTANKPLTTRSTPAPVGTPTPGGPDDGQENAPPTLNH